MNKIILSLVTIFAVAAIAAAATAAYFSDTETSTGNTFAAGTLDLTVDSTINGQNTVKFTIGNMKPTDIQTGIYILNNTGSIDGYLDLESISVANSENGILEPEQQAGDATVDTGELQTLIDLIIWIDADNNGLPNETLIYSGKAGSVAGNYDVDQVIAASGNTKLGVRVDWPSQANDNQAMGDDMTLNMTFELLQNAD